MIKVDLARPGWRHVDIVGKVFRGDTIPTGMGFTDVHRDIFGNQRLHLLVNLCIFTLVLGLQRKFLAAMRHHRELGLREDGANTFYGRAHLWQ